MLLNMHHMNEYALKKNVCNVYVCASVSQKPFLAMSNQACLQPGRHPPILRAVKCRRVMASLIKGPWSDQ